GVPGAGGVGASGTGLIGVPGAGGVGASGTGLIGVPGAGGVGASGTGLIGLPGMVDGGGGEALPVRSVDPATPLHRVALDQRRAAPVDATGRSAANREAPGPCSGPAVLRREAALLTAAQQLGSASCTVDTAVRYAGEREQFGQPIGAFQAVKHLCAQMLVRAEVARSAVYAAAVTGDVYDIAAAKLLADDAAVRNARDCLQVHGGMGFTWEADVHLHLKRAWVRSRQWLPAAQAEELLAGTLVGRKTSGRKAPSTECPSDSDEFG
ncbi:acyl-CoA dehydrogenase family protein, partial [Streptomyces sp. NPDC051776]|uniref:acyl-CoA dehydrogenase family protein n=1 Tax=Streptomyces sp. NPDC051776 TaxID=3155414 RepID=UPI00343F6780